MRFLFLSQIDGKWTLLTKDGAVLTTKEPSEAAPKIVFHPRTPIEFVDVEWLVEEARDAVDAEATAASAPVAD